VKRCTNLTRAVVAIIPSDVEVYHPDAADVRVARSEQGLDQHAVGTGNSLRHGLDDRDVGRLQRTLVEQVPHRHASILLAPRPQAQAPRPPVIEERSCACERSASPNEEVCRSRSRDVASLLLDHRGRLSAPPRSGHKEEFVLPPDDHVHTEWSWDTTAGDMDRTCRRAVELGLPSVAFTDHAEFAPRVVEPASEIPDALLPLVQDDRLRPAELDVSGYLAALEKCREAYPRLRIHSGVELSEPHWHVDETAALLARGGFERVLASVHSARVDAGYVDVSSRYDDQAPYDVVRDYLLEAAAMVEGSEDFEVLAHIDFPVRYWPSTEAPYDPRRHEEEHRRVLRALVASERVLEINTRVPLDPLVLAWWREDGGRAVTFASDAHEPDALTSGFAEAVRVARAAGFRPGTDPHGFWVRD
jgi:histidinol-phosphatase (PHP family)